METILYIAGAFAAGFLLAVWLLRGDRSMGETIRALGGGGTGPRR